MFNYTLILADKGVFHYDGVPLVRFDRDLFRRHQHVCSSPTLVGRLCRLPHSSLTLYLSRITDHSSGKSIFHYDCIPLVRFDRDLFGWHQNVCSCPILVGRLCRLQHNSLTLYLSHITYHSSGTMVFHL